MRVHGSPGTVFKWSVDLSRGCRDWYVPLCHTKFILIRRVFVANVKTTEAPDSAVLSSAGKCRGAGGRCTDGPARSCGVWGIRCALLLRSSDWRKLRTEWRAPPLVELSNHNCERCCWPLPLVCSLRTVDGGWNLACLRACVSDPVTTPDWNIHVQSVDACTKVSPSLIGPSDLPSFPQWH